MSDASILLLQIGFLAVLWLFVLLALGVLRGDLATRAGRRPGAKSRPATSARPSEPAPAGAGAGAKAKPSRFGRTTATTVVIRDGDGERRVELGTAPVTFGRKPDNSIVLQDDYASGHHCRLVPTGKGWQLEDLGSTNGTTMAGKPVTGAVTIPVGGRFTIGRTEVTLT